MSKNIILATATVRINGAIPCVICWKLLTQEDIDRENVVLSYEKMVTPACVGHFYDKGRNNTTRDYLDNVLRFAIARGIAEKKAPRAMDGRLRDMYEEMKTKMKDWNHPAFVSEQFNN